MTTHTTLQSFQMSSLYQPNFKSGIELSNMCSSTVQTLVRGNISWDLERQMNFSIFCNRLFMQINIPAPVVYTGLKYFQNALASSVNDYNMIDISDIAHEFSLLTVSLSLAHKFLEDNPPYMNQWSLASMIPIRELVALEAAVLSKVGFSLNLTTQDFYEWTEQCNTIYEMPYLSLDQLNIDLHITKDTLGYITLLPVLLNDIYNVPPLSTTITPLAAVTTPLTPPIDYFYSQMCNENTNDFLLLDNSALLYPPLSAAPELAPTLAQLDYLDCCSSSLLLYPIDWYSQLATSQQPIFL